MKGKTCFILVSILMKAPRMAVKVAIAKCEKGNAKNRELHKKNIRGLAI